MLTPICLLAMAILSPYTSLHEDQTHTILQRAIRLQRNEEGLLCHNPRNTTTSMTHVRIRTDATAYTITRLISRYFDHTYL